MLVDWPISFCSKQYLQPRAIEVLRSSPAVLQPALMGHKTSKPTGPKDMDSEGGLNHYRLYTDNIDTEILL